MSFLDDWKKIRKAKRVYIVGNGGSYANAVHIANDLISVGIKAYTIDGGTLTAIANDYGYEFVFSRWLAVVGEKEDLLIALSGSGRSPNILLAIKAAKKIGMDYILVSWFLGDGMDMQASEEVQIALGHEWMKSLKAIRERN